MLFSWFQKSGPDMEAVWKRLEAWMKVNAKPVLTNLNPGAKDEAIRALEEILEIKLPADFKAFYKIHNGQEDDSQGLMDAEELLSLENIAFQYSIWKELYDTGDFEGEKSEPAPGVKDDWWNPKWIPITHDGGGNHICIDLDPAPGGKKGQIIRMWHDDYSRAVLAYSFGEWMEAYVKGCEAGQYVYSEDWAAIIDKDNL